MKITATIDRFEGELAVLIEDAGAGQTVAKVDAERSLLPEGASAGDVITLSDSFGEGDEASVRRALCGARLERQATRERGERIESRIQRLKSRGGRR